MVFVTIAEQDFTRFLDCAHCIDKIAFMSMDWQDKSEVFSLAEEASGSGPGDVGPIFKCQAFSITLG